MTSPFRSYWDEMADAYLDKTVILTKHHPHAGKTGVVTSLDIAHDFGRYAFRVELDEGGACYVFGEKQMKVITFT